jgi:hypothetical protein
VRYARKLSSWFMCEALTDLLVLYEWPMVGASGAPVCGSAAWWSLPGPGLAVVWEQKLATEVATGQWQVRAICLLPPRLLTLLLAGWMRCLHRHGEPLRCHTAAGDSSCSERVLDTPVLCGLVCGDDRGGHRLCVQRPSPRPRFATPKARTIVTTHWHSLWNTAAMPPLYFLEPGLQCSMICLGGGPGTAVRAVTCTRGGGPAAVFAKLNMPLVVVGGTTLVHAPFAHLGPREPFSFPACLYSSAVHSTCFAELCFDTGNPIAQSESRGYMGPSVASAPRAS